MAFETSRTHAHEHPLTAAQAAPGPLARRRPAPIRLSLFILQSLWVLPFGCAVGFVWANVWSLSYFTATHRVAFVFNDVGIAVFFGIVTKEVVESALPGGALHPWRRAALPAVSAVGCIAATVAVYWAILSFVAEPMLRADGWGVTCGVDVAMCYLIGSFIFRRHAAMPYLLLLAIASDAIGFACVAIYHPRDHGHLGAGVALMTAALATAYLLRRTKVHSFWFYLGIPGVLSWCALYFGGVHPAMALVPIVPFMPHARRDNGLFAEPATSAHDTLSEFERWWEIPLQVILFGFGVVNAGVPVHGLEAGVWALPGAMMLGRPVGALIGYAAGRILGLHATPGVGPRETFVIGATASVGLTVALYFAVAVMPVGPLLLQLRVGALLSVAGGAAAIAWAHALKVGRFARQPS